MARGERKKGREDKKPKQTGAKSAPQSAYQARKNEAVSGPLKIRNK